MRSRAVPTAVTLAAAALLGACAGHKVAPPYDGMLPAATGPGEAHTWRRLAWKDENGQIPAEALRMALQQRKGVLTTDDWLDEYLGFAGDCRVGGVGTKPCAID